MKVKRMKRAKRILNFFHFNYQYNEPYNILVDGTFCQAALQNKINLREQLPKYLGTGVEIFTTKCVLEELKLLGNELYGALKICENFEVVKCPHNPIRTAASCMERLGRRSKNPTHQKFIIASQDEQLLFNLRDFGGVPLMSIRFNAICLEKPSKESENVQKEESHEFKTLEAMKKSAAANKDEVPRQRKKINGPNPLSCQKKKKRPVDPKPKPSEPTPEIKKKPARRRKKKVNTEVNAEP